MIVAVGFLLAVSAIQVRAVEYTGAVVDYAISHNASKTPVDNMKTNLKRYQDIINNLPPEVDIVVFPENGLLGIDKSEDVQTVVPDPSWNKPDLSNSTILSELAKSAYNNQVYVVVNLVEKSGTKKYNTNVVIRKNGTIAARYRKFNLFNEKVDKPPKPDSVWFDTEMGVRFGTFTCFDILFAKPALDLVAMGVRDFLFPTHWFSELPFLTAGQAQRGWSWGTGTNLLASGLCDVKRGSTGSGLYTDLSKGKDVQLPTPTYRFADSDATTVIVRTMTSPPAYKKTDVTNPNVQKDTTPLKMKYNGSLTLLGEDMSAYKLSELSPKNEDDTFCGIFMLEGKNAVRCTTIREVCHEKFCCHFSVTILHRSGPCQQPSGDPNEFWLFPKRLLAFSGVRDFGGAATGGIDACALITCPHNNCSAAPGPNAPITPMNYSGIQLCTYEVESLKINGDFANDKGLLFPTVLSGRTDDPGLFGAVANDGNATVTWNITNGNFLSVENGHRLGTAGILRRVFSRDGEKPTQRDSSSQHLPSIITLLSLLSTLFILNR